MVRRGILEMVLLKIKKITCKIKEKNRKVIFTTIILISMTILSFLNLGYRNMWTDEAINVVTGSNIVKYGVPKVWNGANLIGAGGNEDIPNYTRKLIEYRYDFLPRYVAAFAQLFGQTNFWLRFPFVVIGIISAYIFYLLVNEVTKSEYVIKSSFVLYTFSAQIIVYIRVAYYYSLVLFMMNLLYLFFIRYLKTQRVKWLVFYAISLSILYHTNHLFFCVALLATLLTKALIFKKNIFSKNFIITMFLTGCSILPFVIWRNINIDSYGGTSTVQGINNLIMQMLGYIWNIQAYLFPFITFGLISIIKKIIIFATKRKSSYIDDSDGLSIKQKKYLINPYVFLLMTTIVLNVVSISYLTYDYAARYMLGSIPACYILTAMFTENLFKNDKVFKIIIILLLFTNIINFTPYFIIKQVGLADNKIIKNIVKPAAPFYPVLWLSQSYTLEEYLNSEAKPKCDIYDYIRGVFSEYNDSTKGIRDFFGRYGRKGDSVYVYGNNAASVLYYTDLNLVVPQNKPGNDQYPAIDLVTKNEDYIDWIIVTASKADPNTHEDLFWVRNPIYECYVINYYNAPCLPELWDYYFLMPEGLNRMLIYRNRLTTSTKIDLNDEMIYKKIVQ